jgi:hypothetical protein
MPNIRVQHTFQDVSGLSEDRYVNTFHFNVPAVNLAEAPTVSAAIKGFWTIVPSTAAVALKTFMGDQTDGPGATIKMYNLEESPPRTVIFEETYNPAAMGGGGNLPAELAVCLSYTAPSFSGIPAASRRGRIYIGPLSVAAMGVAVAGKDRMVDSGMMSCLKGAAAQMASVCATAGWSWGVYSPTTLALYEIDNVYVDDAFDIQRRRGSRPTMRSPLAIP